LNSRRGLLKDCTSLGKLAYMDPVILPCLGGAKGYQNLRIPFFGTGGKSSLPPYRQTTRLSTLNSHSIEFKNTFRMVSKSKISLSSMKKTFQVHEKGNGFSIHADAGHPKMCFLPIYNSPVSTLPASFKLFKFDFHDMYCCNVL